jgi:pimeloyl-ACP methyl ester carboxylesterase
VVGTIRAAQLGMVPGAEHSLPIDKPDIVVQLVADLLPVDFSASPTG